MAEKLGRPSKFDDVDKEYWAFLVEKGYTNREIAMKLGVHESTIYNWMKDHASFFESLKGFREFADSEVEASLYQRAKGYKVKEVKLFQDKRGNIIEHEILKAYPPDPTSMIFWLKNRKPSEWRDKQEIEQTNHVIQIDKQDENL
jgi:transcriptional regulator with XRE-family HTH domain